jgi:hypothetical protein
LLDTAWLSLEVGSALPVPALQAATVTVARKGTTDAHRVRTVRATRNVMWRSFGGFGWGAARRWTKSAASRVPVRPLRGFQVHAIIESIESRTTRFEFEAHVGAFY